MARKIDKYYVRAGKHQRLVLSNAEYFAALSVLTIWRKMGKKLSGTITVSRVGFEGDHPDHGKDRTYLVANLRSLI